MDKKTKDRQRSTQPIPTRNGKTKGGCEVKAGEWDLYKVCNLTVQCLASLATVAMAWIAGCELQTAKVARREVDALQSRATIQEAALSNALNRVNIYGDIIAAEGGDRFAYKRVCDILQSQLQKQDGEAKALFSKLDFAMRRFMGEVKDNPSLELSLMGPLSEDLKRDIVDMLHRRDATQRLCALKHILFLRLNKHVPLVVEMLENEPDLSVVQYAVNVITETFADNMIPNDTTPKYALSLDGCVFGYDDFRKHFMEMWVSAKTRILARKPKEVRERPDPPRGNLIYIYDPEKPDSAK